MGFPASKANLEKFNQLSRIRTEAASAREKALTKFHGPLSLPDESLVRVRIGEFSGLNPNKTLGHKCLVAEGLLFS
jgi:hypothetical protein